MNYAEVGKKVKQKYPQYDDLSDEELGKKVLSKYPQYADVSETPQETSQPQEGGLLNTLKNVGKFFYEPVRNTVVGTTKLAEMVGAGLAGDKQRFQPGRYENLPQFLQGAYYKPKEIEQKFGGETFGQRFKQGGWEGTKVGADIAMYGLPVDKWIAGAGKKLAGPLAKVGVTKFRSPKALAGGIDEAMEMAGKVMDEALTSSKGKISTKPVVAELNKIKQDLAEKGVEEGGKKIDKIIARVTSQGDEITAKQAQKLSSGFWQDVYGEAGKELKKRGAVGISDYKAKKVAGGKLSEATKDLLKKEGLTDGAQAYKTFHELGIVSKEMEQPFKNWWQGGLAGTLAGSVAGAPAAAIGASATLLAMPYTRAVLKKSLSSILSRPVGVATKIGAIKSLNEFVYPEEEKSW